LWNQHSRAGQFLYLTFSNCITPYFTGATCSRWELGAHQACGAPGWLRQRFCGLHRNCSSHERLLRFYRAQFAARSVTKVLFTHVQVKVLGEKGRHARAAVGTFYTDVLLLAALALNTKLSLWPVSLNSNVLPLVLLFVICSSGVYELPLGAVVEVPTVVRRWPLSCISDCYCRLTPLWKLRPPENDWRRRIILPTPVTYLSGCCLSHFC
jgi:hypothetical protein